MRKSGLFLGLLWLVMPLFLAGCAGDGVDDVSPLPTPTSSLLFQERTATPRPSVDMLESTATAIPSVMPITDAAMSVDEAFSSIRMPDLPVVTGATFSDLRTDLVFDDDLNSNWRLLESDEMLVDFESLDYVHNGRFSISMTPLKSWRTMYFAVREDATDLYRQDEVVSISFWINAGDEIVELDDLVFTFIGSNDYPYWVDGDTSAYFDDEFPFSETAFYWLDLNRSLPPNTWVEVEVFVADRIFDPTYEYITGFYIKNADDLFSTVYFDDISINRLPNHEAVAQTPEPVETILP